MYMNTNLGKNTDHGFYLQVLKSFNPYSPLFAHWDTFLQVTRIFIVFLDHLTTYTLNKFLIKILIFYLNAGETNDKKVDKLTLGFLHIFFWPSTFAKETSKITKQKGKVDFLLIVFILRNHKKEWEMWAWQQWL